MKKMLFILMALLVATPAMAVVTLSTTVTDVDSTHKDVKISYAVSDSNRVRAFALDLSLTNGATITACTPAITGVSTSTNRGYGIFPGTITFTGGTVNSYGTPVADDVGNVGALGSSAITIEMGSLYSPVGVDTNAPGLSGDLCTIRVAKGTTTSTNLSIGMNATRGNVVLENIAATTITGGPFTITFAAPETVSQPTVTKTTASPAVADKVNGGRVETFVASATSSISDPLQYQFTWGDGVTDSWGAATQTHTYSYAAAGSYTVTVKARCATHTTIESVVSNNYVVTREAIKSTAPIYADWAAFGRPACWAYPRNCHGDADGLSQGNSSKGFAYVTGNDLNVLTAAWNVKESPIGPGVATTSWNGIPGICADFARDQQGNSSKGFARVTGNDLNLLTASWNVKEPPVGSGVADCSATGHYWFFN